MRYCHGDRGIASQFGSKLKLGKVISKGEDICQIRFERIEPIKKID